MTGVGLMVFNRLKRPNRPSTKSPRQRREGAAAVEFALLAIPFFGLLLAIFEVAIILTVSAILEAAVMNSGRMVRTGQIPPDATVEDFRREICDRMAIFSSACYKRIQIDVQPIASFTNPGVTNPIKDGVFDPNKTKVDIGQARSLMLMRVWYSQPVVSPFLGHAMTKLGNGDTLLHATTAFRNEPYT